MNELTKQVPGASASFEGEIVKALIGKVVDLGSAMQENTAQVKKLADQQDVMGTVNERSLTQEKQMEELIKKHGEVQEELKKIGDRLDIPTDKIETLQQQLEHHSRLFEKPLDKTVHYRHYVGWPILVIASLFILTCGSVGFGVSQWNRLDRYEANDIKWRYIKLSHDSAVMRAVDQTGEAYLDGVRQFTTDVEQEEERREQLFRNIIKQREALKNIEDLNAREKRR